MSLHKNEDAHESFGLVQINRVSGPSPFFFGSSHNPNEYFVLSVYKGCSYVDEFGFVRYIRDGQLPLISLRLTPYQFSELITTTNIGQGVPATIEELMRERVPQLDLSTVKTKTDIAIAEAKKNIKQRVAEQVTKTTAIIEEVENTKLSKELKSKIISALHNSQATLGSNAQHYLNIFQEVGESVTAEIKTNIDATLSGVVQRLGEKALHQKVIQQAETGEVLSLKTILED